MADYSVNLLGEVTSVHLESPRLVDALRRRCYDYGASIVYVNVEVIERNVGSAY